MKQNVIIKDEYYNATVQRLRDFRLLQAGLLAMQSERKLVLETMADTPSAVFRYSEQTVGRRELTMPEAFAEKSLTLQTDLWALNRSIEAVEKAVQCLEYAFQALTLEEKDLVRLRFFEGKRWPDIEEEGNYSESQSKRICARAVWKIRYVIFAHRVSEPGVKYVLLK